MTDTNFDFDSVPLATVLRANERCDEFEQAWIEGQRPQIEDYVRDLPIADYPGLLHDFLHIDCDYRGRLGESPRAQDYVQRFPDLAETWFEDVLDSEEPLPTLTPGRPGLPPDDLQRREFGDYVLLERIGSGGMGVVYKAKQLRPSRFVALKMISAGALEHERTLERFIREADAIAQLHHPHVVQVFEVGEHDGHPYFAMEYIAGGSLDRLLDHSPQQPRAAATLVEKLAQAIQHAHQRGVIHRDLKPANVLMLRDGPTADEPAPNGEAQRESLDRYHPKITDFGLAKLLDADANHPTQQGEVLGTPSYMAPEQLGQEADPISPATDVYGLGAILYELLTGHAPFRAGTALETMLQVQEVEPVSPSRLQPNCPRDLVTICLKCLSKKPHQRYPSAQELAEDLRRFLDHEPIRARPVGVAHKAMKWARRQPMLAALIALLVVSIGVGVGLVSWFWWQAEQGQREAEQALVNEKEALAKEKEARAARQRSLDRLQFELAHREWKANDLHQAETRLQECSEEKRRTWEWRYLDRIVHSVDRTLSGHTNTVQALCISPSGNHIVTTSHDWTVRLWNLRTGDQRTLAKQATAGLSVVISPDGELMASSDRMTGIVRLARFPSGEPVGQLRAALKKTSVSGLDFHPNGDYLAAGTKGQLKVWDMRRQQWVYGLKMGRSEFHPVAFSPDGRYLAAGTRSLKLVDLKLPDWHMKHPVHEWSGRGSLFYDVAFSPDSKTLATGGADGVIRVYDVATKKEHFGLVGHPLSVNAIAFSPDGSRLASVGYEGAIHVWDLKHRKKLFTIHGHSTVVWDLAYTPDGERLVSCGADHLVRVWDARSPPDVQRLPIRSPNEIRVLRCGPKGRLIAWGDTLGGCGVWDLDKEREVFRMPGLKVNRPNSVAGIAFGPEGNRIAFRRKYGLPIVFDRAENKTIPNGAPGTGTLRGVEFSADGDKLFEARWLRQMLTIRDLWSGKKLLSLDRTNHSLHHVRWSPDRQTLLTLEDKRHVRLWSMRTGKTLGEYELETPVTQVTFSRNGRILAVGGVDGKLRAWDLQSKRLLLDTIGHGSNIFGLALSPDGTRLASAASDSTAKLWDTQSGEKILTLSTQLDDHSRLEFSPDGEEIFSMSSEMQVQFWTARRRTAKPPKE